MKTTRKDLRRSLLRARKAYPSNKALRRKLLEVLLKYELTPRVPIGTLT